MVSTFGQAGIQIAYPTSQAGAFHCADEQFEVDEEELERTLSMGTAEKLRDANIPAMQNLYEVQNGFASPRMLQKTSHTDYFRNLKGIPVWLEGLNSNWSRQYLYEY